MNNPAEKMSKAAEDMNKAADDMNKAAENFEKASEEMKVLEKGDEKDGVGQGTDKVADSGADAANKAGLEITDYTEAGDIGEEQMPAFDKTAHTRAWSYASKSKMSVLPEKVKDFVAGL